MEGCAVGPNNIVSDTMNLRRSSMKLSVVELRGGGGEGHVGGEGVC